MKIGHMQGAAEVLREKLDYFSLEIFFSSMSTPDSWASACLTFQNTHAHASKHKQTDRYTDCWCEYIYTVQSDCGNLLLPFQVEFPCVLVHADAP